LCDLDILWSTKERTDDRFEKTLNVSGVHKFLNCHRMVSKQTNHFQEDYLTTNKSLAISEVYITNLNTLC